MRAVVVSLALGALVPLLLGASASGQGPSREIQPLSDGLMVPPPVAVGESALTSSNATEEEELTPGQRREKLRAYIHAIGKYKDDTNIHVQLNAVYRERIESYKKRLNAMPAAEKNSNEAMKLEVVIHQLEKSRTTACENVVATKGVNASEPKYDSGADNSTDSASSRKLLSTSTAMSADTALAAARIRTERGLAYVSQEKVLCKKWLQGVTARKDEVSKKLLVMEQAQKAAGRH